MIGTVIFQEDTPGRGGVVMFQEDTPGRGGVVDITQCQLESLETPSALFVSSATAIHAHIYQVTIIVACCNILLYALGLQANPT